MRVFRVRMLRLSGPKLSTGRVDVLTRVPHCDQPPFGGCELIRRAIPRPARQCGVFLRSEDRALEARDRGVAPADRCRSSTLACALDRCDLFSVWTFRSDALGSATPGGLHAGEHLESAGLHRMGEASRWLGRSGCQRQRFERARQAVTTRVDAGSLGELHGLLDCRGNRLPMDADRGVNVGGLTFERRDLRAPERGSALLETLERPSGVPVHLVHGPRDAGGFLQFFDQASFGALQFGGQRRPCGDELIEPGCVQVVDSRFERGHAGYPALVMDG
jgi:hypothetical protein